jgi:hypothetical protein
MSDDRRARRVARNEDAFRAVNERIEELADSHGISDEGFLCECADSGCMLVMHVPLGEYERVRAHGRRFLVTPGHERPEFELVVEHGDGWLVVEKHGDAGEQAAADDPRGA